MLHICGVSEIPLCASNILKKLFEELTAQILKKRAKKERNIHIYRHAQFGGRKNIKIFHDIVACCYVHFFIFIKNKKVSFSEIITFSYALKNSLFLKIDRIVA